LALFPWLFEREYQGVAFDVALHGGTLVAILMYFWRDWWQMARAVFSWGSRENDLADHQRHRKLFFGIVLASVPAAVAGLLFEEVIEDVFRHPLLMASTLFGMGLLMGWVDKRWGRTSEEGSLTTKKMLAVGCAQALALMPGVSRSGVTLTAGLLAGLSRPQAARFSFLLATPIVAGAFILKFPEMLALGLTGPVFWGFLSSVISGLLVIRFLMSYLQKYSLRLFVYYRVILACVVGFVYFLRL
jgi:undecaprenyl-diphosphatase